MLRFGGLRTTSKEGAGFLEGLKASSSLEVRRDALLSVELTPSLPRETLAGRDDWPKALRREKVPLGGIASFSGSCLRSDRVEPKFLILMRSVDIFLLGLRSVSASAACCAEGVRKFDIVAALCLDARRGEGIRISRRVCWSFFWGLSPITPSTP